MGTLQHLFNFACIRGNLDYAKQLLQNDPNIPISDTEFSMACHSGYLELAKWLLEVKPNIDILWANDFAFNNACSNCHLEVAQWLAEEVNPERYEITEVTIENGKYKIKYKIYPDNDKPVTNFILK